MAGKGTKIGRKAADFAMGAYGMYVAIMIVGEFETNFPTHREVGRKPGGVGKGHPAFFMAQILEWGIGPLAFFSF
jgi:hypothetical protein